MPEKNVLNTEFRPRFRKRTATAEEREAVFAFDSRYWDDPAFPGCGGYRNDGRWAVAAQRLLDSYAIPPGGRVLDVCCGKGFLLAELARIRPDIILVGVDISSYALEEGLKESPESPASLVRSWATALPFSKPSFDLVVCLSALYIMTPEDCREALREIERLGRNKFVQVNSFRDDLERENLTQWDASARTILSTGEWESLFREEGYTGDYYWTISVES